MTFIYDRATTKRIYGIPDTSEYGRWMGTFANGASAWRNMVNQRIKGLPGVLNTTRILVVGCGLGLMVEGLKDEGFQRVWGLCLPDYFSDLWDQATCPVMGADAVFIDPVTKAQTPIAEGQRWPCEVRGDVRPLLGKFDLRTITNTQMRALTGTNNMRFDYIITEDAATQYNAAELPALYNACDAWLAVGGRVVHLLTLNWDSAAYGLDGGPNWTLAQWQASASARPAHTFQDIAGVVE